MALESGNGSSSGKCPLTSNGYHLHSRRCCPHLTSFCDVSKKCYHCSRLTICSVLKGCRARLPGKAAGQGCRARLPGKAAGQGCRARLPGKAAGQGCRARLPGKAAGQGCRARLPGKAAGQSCNVLNVFSLIPKENATVSIGSVLKWRARSHYQ
jgi:hypothetical protein